MALTEGPSRLVHGSLVAPPEAAGNDHNPVEVRMVRDATGCTYHDRRPRLVEGKAGETLTVSHNLAVLWAASGRCVLFSVEDPERAAEPETSPEPNLEPETKTKAPPRKRRRRRK